MLITAAEGANDARWVWYLICRIKKRWRRNTSYSIVDTYRAGKLFYRYYIKDVVLLRSHSFTIIDSLFFSAVIALPPMPSHDTLPKKKTYTNFEKPGGPVYRGNGRCPTINVSN